MSDTFHSRFSPEEMAEIRRSLRDEARFGSEFLGRLKRVAKRVPFAEDLLAAWICTRDPATPRRVRLTLLAALGYFVLPLDAIPDFFIGLGFTDDMAVLLTAISMIRTHLKPEHYDKARETLDHLKRGDGFAE